MNRYLSYSIIIFGVFIILSVTIYINNTFSIYENSFDENIISNIDTPNFQIQDIIYSDPLAQFMKLLSEYGREYFWIVFLIMVFIFGGIDGRVVGLIILISFIIIIPLNIIIKDLIDKDRPPVYENKILEIIPQDKSYPSGHASLVSAGALSVVLSFRKSRNQKILSILVAIEAGLVCISRLYLGVHYPLDVIGGILFGTAVSLLVTSNYRVLKRLLTSLQIKR